VSSRGRQRNCRRKFVITCLSTEDEGDARFKSRNAFVRCSFSMTAGIVNDMAIRELVTFVPRFA